jgi:multidrug efflux pump subunit AcrB
MVRYLIQKPIAVLMTFTALVVTGCLLLKKVPVSLLPDIDVPQIVIRINYPNTPSTVLEQNIVRLVRGGLVGVNDLRNIESYSANHSAVVRLTFEYGARMNLAYVEVNEKIDHISNFLPRDMERPQVIRVNTSDIPIIRLQVIPKRKDDNLQVSALTEKVLRKRLEQLEGVSTVDINGKQQGAIAISPNKESLTALGIEEKDIIQTIQDHHRGVAGLSIKDGQYRYFIKVVNELEDEKAIAALPVKLKDATSVPLHRVARIKLETQEQNSYHLFNGREGIVVTIQKKAASRMNDLVPQVKNMVETFKKEYTKVDFALTQDQTFLLSAGISNLRQDLIYGGILTIALLFLFLGNWVSPLLMSISIPLSLVITFIFFYLFNISFNIISLSGLALAIGMLIDNSIVVIDNITRKKNEGNSTLESSVKGTNEVMSPVISQVLTTVAVYAPLILLNGMAGELVFDQAIGLTISLGVSLLVAFVLVPLLYKLLLKKKQHALKEDTAFYKMIARGYHKMIGHILRYKLFYFLITLLLMPAAVWLSSRVPVSNLPKMEKKESLLLIDWNTPVDAKENHNRTKDLLKLIQDDCTVTEAEVGIKQFLLQQDNTTIQKTEIYFSCAEEKQKVSTDEKVKQWMRQKYPQAGLQVIDAPNAFTQLFNSATSYCEARFKPIRNDKVDPFANIGQLTKRLTNQDFSLGAGFVKEPSISISLDYGKMAAYGVERTIIEEALQQQFGMYTIAELNRFGENITIRLRSDQQTMETKLGNTIRVANGSRYPLNYFLTLNNDQQQKFVTADGAGIYRSVIFDKEVKEIPALREEVTRLAAEYGFSVNFSGQYFENEKQLQQLSKILLIVLFLLYLILAFQYESLIQPFVVMLTIPIGVTGGMLLLWLTGGTLDIMAAIGFIVILGLIVDDPILKMETLNRLEKLYLSQGLKHDDKLLHRLIHEAGDICLKPLLMVSLTTSIALVPVLFVGGIGNDLQRPLAVVIIGGLTIGTFFATWFTPLAYWYMKKLTKKKFTK